jgi:hypothetical protein
MKIKYPKNSFSGDLKEKAYLLGLRTGDIHCRKNHNMIRVESATSHLSQLTMFQKKF